MLALEMKARFGSLIKKRKIGIGVFPSILLTDNFSPQMLPYQLWAFVDMYIVYSNFRNYATPPDEKRCIFTEKLFSCSLGFFFGVCFAKVF